MKKLLGLMFIAMVAFALVGCKDTPAEAENALPVLSGVQSAVTVKGGYCLTLSTSRILKTRLASISQYLYR